jgi:F-type H+-transporting ATPase subunit b
MNFDLTTFFLELINFLVLMWLLQRLFYKPVLNAIRERQRSIDEQVKEATSKLNDAKKFQQQYEKRLEDWDAERSDLMSQVRAEMKEERERQLIKIREEVDNERKRVSAIVDRRSQDEMQKREQAALEVAAQFTTKLLTQLASPELERGICKIFLGDLHQRIHEGVHIEMDNEGPSAAIEVFTVYPLPSDERKEIEKGLKELVGSECSYKFAEDPGLIAGIKVTAGGTVLQANLQDAVTFFRGVNRSASQV